ncbi:PPC domain-containing protein [Rubinisphaera margarita]|uniref:PPC domain-containing protein n=1 Tax=Rubinisphaera margarita TaxID=2909586 RepID=UPI001EE96BED|nr:PPC domain-containing protein [Rubinisphaera margarita]MCG6158158.1 PPC domain-containing protein [Rubinisphaera margarita]
MRAFSRVIIRSAFVVLISGGAASADPWIESVKPRLVGRGTTSEIVISKWRHEAQELIFYPAQTMDAAEGNDSAKGIRCVGTEFDAEKDRLLCRLEVADDCQPGEYPFRVLTAVGLSSMGTVHVGPFPVIDEDEAKANTNDTVETALPVEPNVTVRGTLSNSAADDVDCFRVTGKAGQRLSIEVDMVKMGDDLRWNPVPEGYDSVVTVLDSSGKRIARNDDSSLNRQDPLLSVKLPADGDYTIVLQRSMFIPEAREYAIHIGQFFRPLVAFPLGGPSGEPLQVQLLGDSLGSVKQTVVLPQSAGTYPHFGDAPLPLSLRSSPFPNAMEAADEAETKVTALPVAINGILSEPDQTDRFRIKVKKGEPLQVRVWASALGSPVDPVIKLRPVDAAGGEGAIELEADDATLHERDIFGGHGDFPDKFDPSVVWTPKQDGEYLLDLSDSRVFGGATHVYRIEIAPPTNTMHIGLSWEDYKPERPRKTSLSIPQGGRWTVRLSLYPGQGSQFEGPLDLDIQGLPPGVRMLSPQLPSFQSAWPMTFIAEQDAPLTASLVRVTARSAEGSEPFATVNQQNLQRVSYSHYPWRNIRVDRFAMGVSEPAGFALELEAPEQPLMRGSEMTIPVKIDRQPGCDEPLEIQCEFAPSGVGVSPAEIIPAGETTAYLTLSAAANARLGSSPLYVMATTTQARGGKENSRVRGDSILGSERVRVSSAVIDIKVADPFVSLASEPQSVRRGNRIAYRWAIKQLRPFEGQASVHMLGLPVGLTAVGEAPTIDRTSTEVAVDLEASDEALLGLVGDLQCDVKFSVEGEEIHLRTGSGKLRIDPRLEK